MMIKKFKGKVKIKVTTALLQAYLDILDYDGMKSVLKEAGLLRLKDARDYDPKDTIDISYFRRIIKAQNCLLYSCNNLLYELGKKFSFYLFPYGKAFEEIIMDMNELIQTDWKVEILEKKENSITLKVQNCVFISEIEDSSELFKGFLVNSLEKTLSAKQRVDILESKEKMSDLKKNDYVLTLKIEDIN